MNRRTFSVGASAIASGALAKPAGAQALEGLAKDARDAWLFTLPLIDMAAARTRIESQVAAAGYRPVNHFVHARTLQDTSSRNVTTPNNDTLYSSAFVDLTGGPVTMRVPDPGRRYMSVEVMDMYTNANAVIGLRTQGGPAGDYRLVGPGHSADRPRDIKVLTPHAWVLGRTLSKSEADLPAVHALQDQLTLSGPTLPPAPAYAHRDAPWPDYFKSAQGLVDSDPPTYTAGLGAMLRLRRAGRRGDFSRDDYSAPQQQQIDQGVARAQEIAKGGRLRAKFVDGWSYPPADLAEFKDNFIERAIVAVSGLGALPIEEAMYMRADAGDGTGIFTGDGLYRLHLTGPVPTDAFWSLSMYQAEPSGAFFFTANRLNRYAIGDRTPGLVRGPAGELDIWIGRQDPGEARRANWLPAPQQGPFALTLRAYLPRQTLLDGGYRLPPIERVST